MQNESESNTKSSLATLLDFEEDIKAADSDNEDLIDQDQVLQITFTKPDKILYHKLGTGCEYLLIQINQQLYIHNINSADFACLSSQENNFVTLDVIRGIKNDFFFAIKDTSAKIDTLCKLSVITKTERKTGEKFMEWNEVRLAANHSGEIMALEMDPLCTKD